MLFAPCRLPDQMHAPIRSEDARDGVAASSSIAARESTTGTECEGQTSDDVPPGQDQNEQLRVIATKIRERNFDEHRRSRETAELIRYR